MWRRRRQQQADNLVQDDQRLIATLYRAILKREPDAEGFAWWLRCLNEHRDRPEDVVRGFLESEEARRRWADTLARASIEIEHPRAQANTAHEIVASQELA